MKTLDLVASENYISPLVRTLYLSHFSQNYYLSNDYMDADSSPYPINSYIPEVLNLGNAMMSRLLGGTWADPRPLSGTHAMNCLLAGLLNPGDSIVLCPESVGGHFATFFMAQRLGLKIYESFYDVKNLCLDVNKTAELILKVKPKVVTFDVSHQLFPHPVKELRNAIGEETIITYDASHTLGLLMGGQLQNPLHEGADLVHGSTHKSLPGPQKALFVGKRQDIKEKIDQIIFPRFSSNYHLHHVLGLFACTLEAKFFGKAYAEQIVKNAKALAKNLYEMGLPVFAAQKDFTQTHQLWLDLDPTYVAFLNNYGIRLTNFYIPSHDKKEKALRIGLNSLTRLGLVEDNMPEVAKFIYQGIHRKKEPSVLKKDIHKFISNFQSLKFCFSNLHEVKLSSALGQKLAYLIEEENLDFVFDGLSKNNLHKNQKKYPTIRLGATT